MNFLEKNTKARTSTPMYMLYAELGRYPVELYDEALLAETT